MLSVKIPSERDVTRSSLSKNQPLPFHLSNDLNPFIPRKTKKTFRDLALQMELKQSQLSSPKYLSNPVSPRSMSRSSSCHAFDESEVLEPVEEETEPTHAYPAHILFNKEQIKSSTPIAINNSKSPSRKDFYKDSSTGSVGSCHRKSFTLTPLAKASTPTISTRKKNTEAKTKLLRYLGHQSRISSPKYISNPVSPRSTSRTASFHLSDPVDEESTSMLNILAEPLTQTSELTHVPEDPLKKIAEQYSSVRKSNSQPKFNNIAQPQSNSEQKQRHFFKRFHMVSNVQRMDSTEISVEPGSPLQSSSSSMSLVSVTSHHGSDLPWNKSSRISSAPVAVLYKQLYSKKFGVNKELDSIPEDLEELEPKTEQAKSIPENILTESSPVIVRYKELRTSNFRNDKDLESIPEDQEECNVTQGTVVEPEGIESQSIILEFSGLLDPRSPQDQTRVVKPERSKNRLEYSEEIEHISGANQSLGKAFEKSKAIEPVRSGVHSAKSFYPWLKR